MQTQPIAPAIESGTRPRSRRGGVLRTFRRYWVFYVMMLPALLLLLVNNYLPMVGIVLAFKKYTFTDGILGSPWNGLENFKYLFLTDDAWLMTRNTVLYNLLFIATHLVAAVTFAILLNEMRNRFLAKLHQTIMFLPYFLSWVVISYIGYALFAGEYGFLNTAILRPLGIDPVDWYSEPKYWPYILPAFNLWKDLGYATVIYLAAIVGFDKEYYEAAVIDGASKTQQIRHITLPLLKPIVTILLILSVGKIFYSDFGLFYQFTLNSGLLHDKIIVIDTFVYTALMGTGDVGMAAAAGFYQSIVGFVLILSTNLIIRKVNKDYALF